MGAGMTCDMFKGFIPGGCDAAASPFGNGACDSTCGRCVVAENIPSLPVCGLFSGRAATGRVASRHLGGSRSEEGHAGRRQAGTRAGGSRASGGRAAAAGTTAGRQPGGRQSGTPTLK